jgi:hypothetical protein
MWCLPYINTPQRFYQLINITGCAQRRNRTSLWWVSIDFQNRQKHAWIDIQQQPSLVEQISKQQRPLQGCKGDVQSPMSSVEDSKPFDDLAWTSVEKHQGPWPYLLASSYNEANMANNLARRDGTERLCSGWLQDSDIPRRQERLGPIILWLHMPTPVRNQLPSKLSFELAFNLSGTQVVCSNRSCIFLELAYAQERESYSSNK